MIEIFLIFGGLAWILYNYWKYLKRKKYNSLGPKRRFITEKSQIPKVVSQKKIQKTIYFTPVKARDEIFFSTPHLPFKTPRKVEALKNFSQVEKVSDSNRDDVGKIPVKIIEEQRPRESIRDLGPSQQEILEPLNQKSFNIQHSQVSTPMQSLKNIQSRVQNESLKVDTGKSNKRAFYDEELTQVKKSKKEVRYKTPRRDRETLKRKSTFTVLDYEIDKEFLPEKGWITPMSRRLGRKASRSTQLKERTSVMCQTMPVQQESKRIKVTPALDRVKFKIPESISRPVLQGNELDEKTVQVLLNAANEGVSGGFVIGKESTAKDSLKVPPLEFKAPLAKENISPSFTVDVAAPVPVSAISTITAEVTSEVPKLSFNLPGSTIGTSSPQKTPLSFSLPGPTTPILSTVPAKDTTAPTPKFSFGAPISISSTAVTAPSIPSFGTPISSAGPAATTLLVTTTSTAASTTTLAISGDTKAIVAPTFNFGKQEITPLPTVIAPATTAPISFSFGAKPNEGAATSLTKELPAASAVPTLSFGAPSSAATPSAPQATPFSFGKTPAISTTPSTFNFGSSNAPLTTSAPQSSGLSQQSTVPAPLFGQAIQTSQPPASAAFGNVSGTSAPPMFGQSAPSTSSFGQSTSATSGQPLSVTSTPSFVQSVSSASVPFGQSTPSTSSLSFGQAVPATSAPFGQSAPVKSPFGQTTAAPFGLQPISTTTSAFGQSAPSPSVSSPFGQNNSASTSFGAAAPFGNGTAPPTFGQAPASSAPPSFGQAPASSAPPSFGQAPASSAPPSFGQAPASSVPPSFGQAPASSAPPSFGQSFGQQSGGTGFGMTSGAAVGQGATATAFGQPSSGFPSTSFGQPTTSHFNPSTPAAPFGAAPSPFGNTSSNAPSFGFSNAPVQFGAQAPANPQASFNAPPGSAFTFGQPQQAVNPSFSFGAQSPGIAPASPGFSFNAPGAPQLPQMPSGPGFSLGAGGDTTRKLAQPKGRLRKAGLRR